MKDSFIFFDPMKDCCSTLPNIPGNYLIVLRPSSQLPQSGITPELRTVEYENIKYEVIYTGISNAGIRDRDYKQHFAGNNAGKSTLRKSLGCLMGFTKISRDKNKSRNKKTKFNKEDEEALSVWMKENLLLLYCTGNSTEEIDKWEQELINLYNPPLNLLHNKNIVNKEYRANLKKLRSQK